MPARRSAVVVNGIEGLGTWRQKDEVVEPGRNIVGMVSPLPYYYAPDAKYVLFLDLLGFTTFVRDSFQKKKVEDGVPEAKQWHAALAQFKIAQVEVERAYRRLHEHLGKLLRRPMRRGKPSTLSGRVAAAIADYERTRMSGNAPYDRWR